MALFRLYNYNLQLFRADIPVLTTSHHKFLLLVSGKYIQPSDYQFHFNVQALLLEMLHNQLYIN